MPDPPLYNSDDPDPDPPSSPVSTGPVAAPLVSTGGLGTNFADPGDRRRYLAAKERGASEEQALLVGDPGIGAPALGTVNTAQAYGVAIPEDYLRKTFGDDPAAWRTARVQLKVGDKTITVPIVDVGPGKKSRARGAVSDITDLLWKGLGLKDENPQVNIKLMPGAGPDYSSDRASWDAEQKQISAALQTPMALSSPAPTPLGSAFPNIGALGQSQAQTTPATISSAPEDDFASIQKWLTTAMI